MVYDDTIPDSVLLTIHPELAPLLAKQGTPPTRVPTRSNINQFRAGYAIANKRLNTSQLATNALGVSNPEDATQRYWNEIDHTVPTHDNNKTTIPIRIYIPKSTPRDGVPVVVLLHGGGWIMGDLNTEALLARVFCAKLGVCVVNVGFRNYPDVDFGVPVLDCFAAVKWTARNSSPGGIIRDLGGNCEVGFVLAGVSGGATFASICAHLARDDPDIVPPVTGQWLSCPVLGCVVSDVKGGEERELFDLATLNRSQVQNRDAPLMNRKFRDAIRTFADYDGSSKLLTPFLFESHRDLGRGGVYVQVAGLDPWRDSGRIYQGLCAREGNRTRLTVYPGLLHCWWTSFPMMRVTAVWLEDCVKGLKWLLEEQVVGDERGKAKL